MLLPHFEGCGDAAYDAACVCSCASSLFIYVVTCAIICYNIDICRIAPTQMQRTSFVFPEQLSTLQGNTATRHSISPSTNQKIVAAIKYTPPSRGKMTWRTKCSVNVARWRSRKTAQGFASGWRMLIHDLMRAGFTSAATVGSTRFRNRHRYRLAPGVESRTVGSPSRRLTPAEAR